MLTLIDQQLSIQDPEKTGADLLEGEVIDFFVQLFRLFNLPRSVAEIYGLLFSSPHPLPMDGIMTRLNMSKGAVSQGLKLLREFGAIRVHYITGDRRDHFSVEVGMRQLAAGFLKEKLIPSMEKSAVRLKHLEDLLKERQDPKDAQLAVRFKSLRGWQNEAKSLLPIVKKFLEI